VKEKRNMKDHKIGGWLQKPEEAGNDLSRRVARETVDQYKREAGDIDFGSSINEELFVKYLALHASGADNMRGYWAAFNRSGPIGGK
jgi:hypothetical protein